MSFSHSQPVCEGCSIGCSAFTLRTKIDTAIFLRFIKLLNDEWKRITVDSTFKNLLEEPHDWNRHFILINRPNIQPGIDMFTDLDL